MNYNILLAKIRRFVVNRITPACAGKIYLPGHPLAFSWDHPRVCGKNCNLSTTLSNRSGSLPHVREKPYRWNFWFNRFRITPACAGKTTLPNLDHYHYQDHTRVCGKNSLIKVQRWRKLGSPPRVREKLRYSTKNTRCTGITPACAGKTTLDFARR